MIWFTNESSYEAFEAAVLADADTVYLYGSGARAGALTSLLDQHTEIDVLPPSGDWRVRLRREGRAIALIKLNQKVRPNRREQSDTIKKKRPVSRKRNSLKLL